MEVSRSLLQNAHETYTCGGTLTLPLKLSDEVQVVLRHLRQLDMLPARQVCPPLCLVAGPACARPARKQPRCYLTL